MAAKVKVGQQTRNHIANLGVAGPFVFVEVANHRLANGFARVDQVGLVEHSNVQVFFVGDASAVWLESTREQFDKR